MAKVSPSERFAQNTLELLADRGLTVGWLARRVGIADSTLRFQLANPDTIKLRVALAIAAELDMPSESILAVA